MVYRREEIIRPAGLVNQKISGEEKGAAQGIDTELHQQEYERLVAMLEKERNISSLPETSMTKAAINDLPIRLRLTRHKQSRLPG